MNIHEYQAKAVLRKYGVPVPNGKVAYTPEEAEKAAQELSGDIKVVKAQIHAGGRGKAGGVKIAKNITEVKQYAKDMLGMTLVTHQTGPEGKVVKRVYIEEASNIATELYLGIVVDRASSCITFMISREGGVDIEEVAAHHPEKIIMVTVDPAAGFQPFHARKMAFALGLNKEQQKHFHPFVVALYQAFVDTDASQVEINPLVITADDKLIALDAKFNFDENALYRHEDIAEMRDPDEEDPLEQKAAQYGLAYVKMDGNIGCMVNGAGLAMATMDIIKLHGSEPANFLDVGGGANKEKVTHAFKLILSDPSVEGILVNIFGGIMRCDTIAEGVIAAAKEVSLSIPLVVRLEGTNVELGKKMLASSGLDIIPADNLEDAAQKIVSAVSQKKAA
ncbi:MAG: ADP-forming succinate--CoA ligase subunit beta [Alphaproteobacteria bacterium]|nr:MAG: ADP-forming succinate--CoA ligase subunit beta [Alphaproteobacteria bacterium]TAF77173.1 MAG: ADP-forming succinate--CoA ligase subunit beta [Alphaproteobacteria bacterium]